MLRSVCRYPEKRSLSVAVGGGADVRFVQSAFGWKCSDSEKENYEDTTKGLVNCIRCSDFTQIKQV